MEILIQLVILLAGAKLLGEICEKLHVPSIIGYVATGMIFGPMLFNISSPEQIAIFADLGIILLVFMTGFNEGHIEKLVGYKRNILLISIFGYVSPFVAAFLIGSYFKLDFTQILIVGLAVSSTSISPTLKTLIDIKRINTNVGRTMLGATITNGVFDLLMFTLVITYISIGKVGITELFKVAASLVLFLLIFLLTQRIGPKIIDGSERLAIEEGQFTVAFIFILCLTIIAQYLGLQGIVGAFLAGMILARTRIVETDFLEKISAISYAIFIPLFFVWTGLLTTMPAFSLFSVVIVVGALLSNFLGPTIGAKLSGMSHRDSIAVGFGMTPVGELSLVILSLGKTMGILSGASGDLIFSSMMLLIAVGVIIAPIFLRKVMLEGP